MKKIVILFSILLTYNYLSAQVTIGELTAPDPSSVLQVISPDHNKGILIPAMTRAQRENIANPANGLMIFNLDENCFNYYDAINSGWTSLCGGIPNAAATIDCDLSTVSGTFVQGFSTAGSYMSVPVTVAKPGMYTMTAAPNPANGYYFTSSGSFPAAGNYIVNLPANGIPTIANPAGDFIALTFNGTDVHCSNLTVPVNAAQPDYTIASVSVIPSQFPVATPLDPLAEYLVVTLNVKVPGTWMLVSSDPGNGYSFSAQGEISQASGYNPSGSFPQVVTVIVPVTGGEVMNYGTGSDMFTLSNLGSVTPSNFPFMVNLAKVGLNVDCTSATVNGDSLVQNQALTNQTITLPVTVISPGTTTITASCPGMTFTSGEITFHQDTTIILYPQTTSAPSVNGNQSLLVNSSEGGLKSSCGIPVSIQTAEAVLSSIALSAITPSSGNFIVDVKGNTQATVSLSVICSQAGIYNLSTQTVNGVTYSASGTLIASALPQIIVLQPTGTPTGVSGKTSYSVSSGSTSVNFDINYVYRAMKIMVISGAANYDLSKISTYINTSATGNTTLEADKNFGINGTVPTAGITVSNGTAASGELAAAASSGKYDIIILGYANNAWNAADVTGAVSYVQNNGVLFLCTENYGNATSSSSSGTTIESIMAKLFEQTAITYGTGSNLWYSGGVNQGIYITGSDVNDPILNGPFGNITGKYLGDDYAATSSVLAGTLSPTVVPLASPLPGATLNLGLTPSKSCFAVRHATLPFVWAGDGGFFGAYLANTVTNNGSPIGITNPLSTKNWDAIGNSGLSGVQQVSNGQFLFNVIAYGIQYAGTHARQ